ncbi:MAG: hypothetical protein HKO48_02895 [Nitrosopumilus sp.]|nr:hypothetical protein [Nitrosopumilus sp.]NNM36044.1 hypothetical protein [Nitrosopumilus sp.]
MKFERRDIVLVVGLFLFMIGLTPFTGLALAAVIVIIMFFGIKVYVEKRRQSIAKDVGDGLCMECGSVVVDKKCPNCDYSQE